MRQSGNADRILKYGFAFLMAGAIVWSFLVPDDPLFQYPATARIFFWHFPCPMLLQSLLFLGCYFSFRYFVRLDLRKKDGPMFSPESDLRAQEEWDLRAAASLEVGLIFGCLTLISGMLFSAVAWGSFWQWDPRQTSFLLALLIYAAYFALRTAFRDPIKRGANSAAYILAAVLPLTFLILVFPRLPGVEARSFHPTNTITDGLLRGQYAYVTICLVVLVSILAAWVYRLRVRVGLISLKLHYGKLENSGGSTRSTVMVRPVLLPDENRL